MTDPAAPGRGPYDFDVAVVGAGPAGLAAAIRVRWVKGFDPVPSSVVILDPAPLGGLAGWGSCMLTGPGWTLDGAEIVGRMRSDVDSLGIPHLRHGVDSVEREGSLLRVRTAGRSLTALAVVLAPGLRRLANESSFFPDGVVIAMKGRAHIPALLARAADLANERGLVVLGNAQSRHIEAALRPLAARTPVTWLLDPAGSAAVPSFGRVVRGRLSSIEGSARVEGINVESGGAIEHIRCGAVFIDYHAFEIQPSLEIRGLDKCGVRTTGQGFIDTDPWCRTSAPGVFAAGDINGRYAATLTALGDGVCAGFSAYRYAYALKFGSEPDLFAYRGVDLPLPTDASSASLMLSPTAVPVLVGQRDRARRCFERVLSELEAERLVEAIDRGLGLGALAVRLGLDMDRVEAAVREAIHGRELTVHTLATAPA